MVGFAGADGPQQRIQPVIFAYRIGVAIQLPIFQAEQLRGGVGAFDQGAEANKALGVVAQQSAEHRAAKQMRALFHPVEERVDADFIHP